MHELVRISVDKWYALEGLDLDVGGAIALIGPTGAGKSAILDCIQTVLTGNNQNFLDLNASAGQEKGRTVRSYCLGAISDVDHGAPPRDDAEAVLALSFKDTETGLFYGIGLLLKAHKDEPREETIRFIVRGHLFSIRDYIERNVDGEECMLGQEAIIERLKSRYGKSVTFHNSSAESFVAEYLTAMRPKLAPDPKAYLRSIKNARAAKTIGTPTDFVRRFILPPKPLNVERMRISIKNWKQLDARAVELEQEIREIHVVRSRFATWARQIVSAQTDRFMETFAERLRLGREIQTTEKEIGSFEEKIAELDRLSVYYRQSMKTQEEDIRHKQRMIDASGAAVSLRAIEVEEKSASEERRRAAADLEAAALRVAQVGRLEPVRSYLPIRLHSAIEAGAAFARMTAASEPENWAQEIEHLAPLAAKAAAIGEAAQSLRQQRDARISELQALEVNVSDLREQVGRADAGGPVLSRHVRLFMAELESAGITARPLPDLVEVLDESWAPALEMILGANREALLVQERHLDRAFDLLWRRRNEFYGCRIINTRKTAKGATRPTEDSIARIVRADDPHLRVFIDREAGRWICAEKESDLELHERAIMRNGKASAGASLRVYQDLKPILGRTAQVSAAEAARAELGRKAGELKDLRDEYRMIEGAIAAIDALQREDVVSILREAADRVALARARLKSLASDRHALEDDTTRALREDIEALKEDIRRAGDQLKELADEDRKAKVGLDLAKNRLEEKRAQVAQLVEREKDLECSQQSQTIQDLILHAEVRDETIAARKGRLMVDLELHQRGREMEFLAETRNFSRQSAAATEAFARENGKRAMREKGEYAIRRLGGRDPLPQEAEEGAYFVWCVDREKRLEEHELRPHREQVAKARQEVERSLKDDLLSKLHERFELVRVQVDQLNRRLENYAFVGQRYSFSRWIAAEYKPLYEVAKSLGKHSIGDLTAADAGIGDEDLRQVLVQIDKVLVDEEEARRLEDYRNYFEFELNLESADNPGKPQALSKIIGLLSGGQREAPYYVAIAASMVSVCFPQARDRGTAGVGIVPLDEAFRKLDIGNTQQLIRLYKELGLQLIIATPEEARPVFLESVDCVISVARQGRDVLVDVAKIGPRAKAAMRAENPEHKGIEGFRRDLSARQAAAEAAD